MKPEKTDERQAGSEYEEGEHEERGHQCRDRKALADQEGHGRHGRNAKGDDNGEGDPEPEQTFPRLICRDRCYLGSCLVAALARPSQCGPAIFLLRAERLPLCSSGGGNHGRMIGRTTSCIKARAAWPAIGAAIEPDRRATMPKNVATMAAKTT
jgi:hypothetical protein